MQMSWRGVDEVHDIHASDQVKLSGPIDRHKVVIEVKVMLQKVSEGLLQLPCHWDCELCSRSNCLAIPHCLSASFHFCEHRDASLALLELLPVDSFAQCAHPGFNVFHGISSSSVGLHHFPL